MSSTALEKLSNKGYIVRPATMNDLEAAVELFNACALATIGVRDSNIDEKRIEWQSPGFNMETDTRTVHSPDRELIGYIDVWDLADPPVHPWVWGGVHPEWEGRGIGTTMMTWAQARARKAIARVPKGVRVAMMCYTPSKHKPTKRLFESLGLKKVRHSWQMAIVFENAPATPEWPQEITLHGYNHPKDAEAVFRVEDEIFSDHWGYVPQPFESAFKRWLHFATGREDFDPTLWTMAMDGDEIAGLLRCRLKADEDPEMGWVSVLSVRRPWRGRGLGSALLQHAFIELYSRGKRRAGLGVDAENLTGATRLYEKAGMHILREYDTYQLELRPGTELGIETLDS